MFFDGPNQILPFFHHLMTFDGPKNIMSFDEIKIFPFQNLMSFDGPNFYIYFQSFPL